MLLTTVTLAACPEAALDAVIRAEDNLLTAIDNRADPTVLRDLEDGAWRTLVDRSDVELPVKQQRLLDMLLTTFTVTLDINVRERLMRFEVVARAWLPQRREAYKTALITEGSGAIASLVRTNLENGHSTSSSAGSCPGMPLTAAIAISSCDWQRLFCTLY
eukprot:gene15063-10777_t